MTLIEHFEELRWRLLIAVVAWAAGASVAFFFRSDILLWLREPVPDTIPLFYRSILEPFSAAMSISLFFGFLLASPVILGQVWGFIAPGLYDDERRWAIPFVLLSVLAFLGGSLFAYYAVLPFSLPVLFGILGEAAVGMLSIGQYISNLLALMAVFGLMFEMPVLAFLLARIGLLVPEPLIRYRRYAVMIGVVLAAIITPTGDPVNLALVAGPLLALYELSILVVRIAKKRTPHERERDHPEPA